MYNKINFETLMQALIELFISLLIFFSIATKNINNFVHPKFNLIILLSGIFMLALSIVSFKHLNRPRHINNIAKYFILILPLICPIYINDFAFKFNQKFSTGSPSKQSLYASKNVQKPKYQRKIYRPEEGKAYIDVDDSMYLKWYYESVFNLEPYRESEFKMLVRVFKDQSQDGQYVVLGRMGMVCCMADLQVCGFVYRDKGYENLIDGQWYWVKGKLKENHDFTYNMEELPYIYNIKLEKAKKPLDEYVYLK